MIPDRHVRRLFGGTAPVSERLELGRAEPATPLMRVAYYLVSPSKGMPKTWLVLVLLLAFGTRSSEYFVAALVGTFLVGWACMLAVTAVMPPPPKISETSALAARFSGFMKVTRSACMFTAGAVYGGLVSVTMATSSEWQSSAAGVNDLQQFIWPIVGYAATVAGVYGVVACAIDLHRAGDEPRTSAIRTILRPMRHLSRFPWAQWWAQELLEYWVSGWRPLVLAISAPAAAPILWKWIELAT